MPDFCLEFNSHVLCVMIVLVFFCAVIGGVCLLLFSDKPDAIGRFKQVKEVMIMFLGLVGAIVGFYMGR